MHWADVIARELAERSKHHVIATGITPSGEIHLGNMREILTADAICRALHRRNISTEMIYVADTFDPLRKRYPFLSEEYEEYVGKPLSRIPCPCGSHENYALHFLEPFLDTLEKLDVVYRMVQTHNLYREGKYEKYVKLAMEHREEIRKILENKSHRKLPSSWFPYNAICSGCGKFTKLINGYDNGLVAYTCECGYEGKINVNTDNGKLLWRVDWPARWCFLNVTCEPFGKDHATVGGSYDTAKDIIETVFRSDAPYPVVYEWVHLKGKGAMHSSTGVAVNIKDMISSTSPEILRFLMMRVNPNKHIEFDPAHNVPALFNEYDKYERIYFDIEDKKIKDAEDKKRIYELSQCGKIKKTFVQVSYAHMVILAQIRNSFEEVIETLKRTTKIPDSKDVIDYLRKRYNSALYWLEHYAPANIKIKIIDDDKTLKQISTSLDKIQMKIVNKLCVCFEKIDWTPENIHTEIYNIAKHLNTEPRMVFELIYLIFIGQRKGPRIGYLLSSLNKKFVVDRLRKCVVFGM